MDQNQINWLAIAIFGTSLIFTHDIVKSFLITGAYGVTAFALNEESKNKKIPLVQDINVKQIQKRGPGSSFSTDTSIIVEPIKNKNAQVYN